MRRHCQPALARCRRSRAMGWPASGSRKYSFRSCPAEKASPAPVMTTQRALSSISSTSMTCTISKTMPGLKALRLEGRLSVTQAMPSSTLTRTFCCGRDASPEVASVMSFPPEIVASVMPGAARRAKRFFLGVSWGARMTSAVQQKGRRLRELSASCFSVRLDQAALLFLIAFQMRAAVSGKST